MTPNINPQNPIGLKNIHHVELWVGNAKQATYFYRKAFGFSQLAYSGLETGNRDTTSYALQQGKARFLLTTPLGSDNVINDHIVKHGDGVRDIAFHVDDTDYAYEEAIKRGAESAIEPRDLTDDNGTVRHAAVKTYGDTIHSLISYKDYKGVFLPGFQLKEVKEEDLGIVRIDHIVGNVELGKMDFWCDYYHKVFGFERFLSFDDEDISTEYSSLMSIVMSDNSHAIKFPINEPASGKRKSQIEEYLDFYGGPGAQHVALLCKDITQTVDKLRQHGVDFLSVPSSYYETLSERVGKIEEDLNAIQNLNILVDKDDEGYLLQIFTKPVEDRPTLFFEIIERHGAKGFGKGNFKALFESIEAEQAKRGNL